MENKKRVIICRGLPGSGKSTFTSQLGEGVITCSADHFFEKTGTYVFDPKMLFLAHKICRNKFEVAVEAGAPVVVVDNTNIKYADWKNYLMFAIERGYLVTVAEAKERDIDVLLARGKHNVPRATLERMAREWKDFDTKGLSGRDRIEIVKF